MLLCFGGFYERKCIHCLDRSFASLLPFSSSQPEMMIQIRNNSEKMRTITRIPLPVSSFLKKTWNPQGLISSQIGCPISLLVALLIPRALSLCLTRERVLSFERPITRSGAGRSFRSSRPYCGQRRFGSSSGGPSNLLPAIFNEVSPLFPILFSARNCFPSPRAATIDQCVWYRKETQDIILP